MSKAKAEETAEEKEKRERAEAAERNRKILKERKKQTVTKDDATGLPKVVSGPVVPVQSQSMPLDDEYEGVYIHRATGEPYALAVVKDDTLGKTHKLKNTEHFMECTEDEFRLGFDKHEGKTEAAEEEND